MFNIPFQIINNDQVEPAVVVHIDPGCRNGPKWSVLGVRLVQTRFGGDIRKSPVPVVVVQRVAVYPGDKNIFIPVVVIIADGDARVIAGSGKPRFFGYVGEMSPAIVLKKAVGILRGSLAKRLDVGSVGEEDVQFAVVVEVKHGDTASHGFRSVAFRRFVAFQLEVDGLVNKTDLAIPDYRVSGGVFGRSASSALLRT